MLQYVIFGISFVSLYLIIVWLTTFFLSEPRKEVKGPLPKITLVVPAYNEAENIEECIYSIFKARYPKENLTVYIVNNGSTDQTSKVVSKFIKKYNLSNFKLLELSLKGKAYALNKVLSKTTSPFFGVIDADSRITENSIQQIISNFNDENTGAAISSIKAINPKNFLEKMQRVEYLNSIFVRNILSQMNTLYITPGVLSIYRTSLLKKLHGFDNGNVTEDFEIALRLRSFGYTVKSDINCMTFTKVPPNFTAFINQRTRWGHGFFLNLMKYKHLIFNPKYSYLGMFQMPMLILGIPMLITSVSIILFSLLTNFYKFLIRSLFIDGFFASYFTNVVTLRELIFGLNLKTSFIIYISIFLGFFFIYIVHRATNEKIWPSLFLYIFVIPYMSALQWFFGFYSYVRRDRKKG